MQGIFIAKTYKLIHHYIMKKIKLSLLSFILLVSCQNPTSSSVSSLLIDSVVPSSLSTSITSSVNPILSNDFESYGDHERNVLEYARKNDNLVRPMVLLVHGGSWIGGDKSMMREFRNGLVEAGYIYVSMNYQLIFNGANFETMLADIRLAINYMRSNASFLKLDTTQMAILGVSAGGHLSLLYAYAKTSSIPIDLAIGIVPPVDFTDPNFITTGNTEAQLYQMNTLTGTNIATAEELEANGYPQAWQHYSPIYHVATSVPTVLAYAGKDLLIPNTNVPRLISALEEQQQDVESVYFPNSGHNLESDLEQHIVLQTLIYTQLQTYLG